MDPPPARLDAVAVGCFALLAAAIVALAWLDPRARTLLPQVLAASTLLAALALGRRHG